MDHKPSNPQTDSWVDERLASLAPAPEWTPNTQRVLNQILRGQKASGPRWMSLGMTATILATTVVVLALLPWQRLWTTNQTQKSAAAAVTQAETQQTTPQAPPTPADQAETAKAAKIELHRTVLPVMEFQVKPTVEAEKFRQMQALEAKVKAEFEEVELAKRMRAEASATGQSQSSGVTQPSVLSSVQPPYTEEAKQSKVTGTVVVQVLVLPDGSVQFDKIINSLGYGLDESAIEAIKRWRFNPGSKDGVPVATTVQLNVTFSLR